MKGKRQGEKVYLVNLNKGNKLKSNVKYLSYLISCKTLNCSSQASLVSRVLSLDGFLALSHRPHVSLSKPEFPATTRFSAYHCYITISINKTNND